MKKLIKIMIVFVVLIVINTKEIYADEVAIERWQDSNGVWHYSPYGTGSTTNIEPSTDTNILHIVIAGIIVIVICVIAFIVLKKVAENQKERKNKDDMEN